MNIRRQWRTVTEAIAAIEEDVDRYPDLRPSSRMCSLLIVAEDHRFELHPGLDPLAICRAGLMTYVVGQRQGASTIAMQLVRTITKDTELTVRRKLVEMLLAIQLTQQVSRNKLPLFYLWCGYYGWNMNNFRAACRRLNLVPSSMTRDDEARLVAMLKYPLPERCTEKRENQIQNRATYMIRRLEYQGAMKRDIQIGH